MYMFNNTKSPYVQVREKCKMSQTSLGKLLISEKVISQSQHKHTLFSNKGSLNILMNKMRYKQTRIALDTSALGMLPNTPLTSPAGEVNGQTHSLASVHSQANSPA